MVTNIAFLNAVELNGGVITPELRAKFGIDGAKPAPADSPAPAGGNDLVQIPEDWQSLKWMKKQALAKAIDPAFEPDKDNRVASIDAVIEAELARRAG